MGGALEARRFQNVAPGPAGMTQMKRKTMLAVGGISAIAWRGVGGPQVPERGAQACKG